MRTGLGLCFVGIMNIRTDEVCAALLFEVDVMMGAEVLWLRHSFLFDSDKGKMYACKVCFIINLILLYV